MRPERGRPARRQVKATSSASMSPATITWPGVSAANASSPCHRHGLQSTLSFMIKLIVRQMIRQPDPPVRLRSQNLGHKAGAGELMGAFGDMQINLHHGARRPPAGRSDSRAVRLQVAGVRH
jgi:hypothetical protein